MAQVREVAVPDIGDYQHVPVIEILVEPGQEVRAEESLLTLESDKAAMDVPAPEGGIVRELKVAVGDTVSRGTVVLTLEPTEGAGASTSPPDGMPDEATKAEPILVAQQAEAASRSTGAPSGGASSGPAATTPGDVPYASPSVRRRARELSVDLTGMTGTGRKGRITVEDLAGSTSGGRSRTAGSAAGQGEQREPLTRIQRRSAENLTNAWQTIPHVTHHEEADITDLEAFRKRLNAEQSDVKVTMVALLLKASAAALDEFPRFASSLDGDDVVIKPQRHVGFAADTPNGLVVPVIHDVDGKGLFEIAAELTELSSKARAGKLGPKEMSGAVFTISSLGGIGGTGFTPIVNPPQVAILGAVRSAMKPVWNGSEFRPRLMLPLSLSYDHRVIDGAAAARFCVHLRGLLEDMRRALL